MPITLADFFKSPSHCRQVAARPVTFTATSKSSTLPSGLKNPGSCSKATVTAAFVFVSATESLECRVRANEALRRPPYVDEKGEARPTDADVFRAEVNYQILHLALREWDADNQKAGKSVFDSVDGFRDMVVLTEMERLVEKYNAYVKDEHPEGLDAEQFPAAEKAGEGVVRAAPR